MGINLSVYDVSALVYAGVYSPGNGNDTFYNYPVAGIHYLMKFIVNDLISYNDVVLCFDSRTERKKLQKDYKAGREQNLAVYSQLNLLYEFLPKCGIACYKKDGYEADDLIYNVCNYHKNNYNNVNIYGTDYDLSHNVDEYRVKFCSVSSQVNSVNCLNFSHALVKGKKVYFNTIATYKVFCGDRSDSISPFTSENGMTGTEIYEKFYQMLDNEETPLPSHMTRLPELLDVFLEENAELFTAKDLAEIEKRKKLVFPMQIDMDYSKISTKDNVDWKLLGQFLASVGDKVSLRSIGPSVASKEMIDLIKKKADELSTGKFAADNSMSLNYQPVQSEMLFLKAF